MRLRNKKTGKIIYLDYWNMLTFGDEIVLESDNGEEYCYHSLTELIEEWEDAEDINDHSMPLIKDEKIRKAIRTWLSIQKQPITAISILCNKDHDGFFCYHLYGYIDKARIVDGRAVVNNNLTSIDFEFRSNESIEYEPHRDYAIAELCGEEKE